MIKPEHDIRNRDDIERLLISFYDSLLKDDSINYIFTEVAKLNFQTHIPIITDFWETVLFQTTNYRKNAIQVHLELNKLSPLTPDHFNTWLNHFNKKVDELYTGPMAELTKQRAQSIATIMQIKIRQQS